MTIKSKHLKEAYWIFFLSMSMIVVLMSGPFFFGSCFLESLPCRHDGAYINVLRTVPPLLILITLLYIVVFRNTPKMGVESYARIIVFTMVIIPAFLISATNLVGSLLASVNSLQNA